MTLCASLWFSSRFFLCVSRRQSNNQFSKTRGLAQYVELFINAKTVAKKKTTLCMRLTEPWQNIGIAKIFVVKVFFSFLIIFHFFLLLASRAAESTAVCQPKTSGCHRGSLVARSYHRLGARYAWNRATRKNLKTTENRKLNPHQSSARLRLREQIFF